MRFVVRFVTSLAITLWGMAMVALGLFQGVAMWSLLGLVVAGVGLPLLASHPWATGLLYPSRAGERASPPESQGAS